MSPPPAPVRAPSGDRAPGGHLTGQAGGTPPAQDPTSTGGGRPDPGGRAALVWLRRATAASTWLVIAAAFVTEIYRRMSAAGWMPSDHRQEAAAFYAISIGRLALVYPPHTGMTSPPGFLILAAPLVTALGGSLLTAPAEAAVGGLSALAVAAGFVHLARTMRGRRAAVVDRLIFLVILLAPQFAHTILVTSHPEDLVALALVTLATAEAVRGRPLGVGLSLGAAILTRQWALLVAPPLLVYLGPSWRRAAGVAGALFVGATLPYALVDPRGVLHALSATNNFGWSRSFWSLLPIGKTAEYIVARDLAPLACVPLTLALRRRWAASPAGPVQLLGAVLLFLDLRMVFETMDLDYYMAPVIGVLVLVVCIDPDRERRVGALILAGGLTAFVVNADGLIVTPWFAPQVQTAFYAAEEAIFVGMAVLGWLELDTRFDGFLAQLVLGQLPHRQAAQRPVESEFAL